MAVSACSSGSSCVHLPLVSTRGLVETPLPPAAPSPTAVLSPTPIGEQIVGLAIMGDSTQDEYRTDDNRGGEYAATTLNWVELLVRLRGVNVGPQGTFEEPRRRGYEYNWSRSGTTTVGMMYWGQDKGVAEQIKAGKVSHVLIQIGINDFKENNLGYDIASGKLSGEELHKTLNTMASYVEDAIETLRQAGDARILVAAVQDYVSLDLVINVEQLNDPAAVQRVTEAFDYLNQQIEQAAMRQGVPYFDFNAAMQAELDARRDRNNYMVVGGEKIDLGSRGNEPHFGLLDDEYMHPGSVLSAMFTNVYIRKMNENFGTTMALLSDDEILRAAGIKR